LLKEPVIDPSVPIWKPCSVPAGAPSTAVMFSDLGPPKWVALVRSMLTTVPSARAMDDATVPGLAGS
jgi:hypothetical protein